jgi:hypothetical protein
MEQEIATLILNTFDINSSTDSTDYYNQTVDNQFGTITNNRCNLTWKNVNLRNLLGTIYDRYETFNLYLYQVSQSGGFGLAPSSNPHLLVDIRLGGLPWLNNSYNNFTRTNTDTVFLTSYLLNNGASGALGIVTPMFNPTIFTFSKSSDNVNITIDMRSTNTKNYPTMVLNQAFGTFNFMFKIKGIPSKPNSYINASRMNIN